jgi:uncharacterized protein (DUF433 family)
MVKPHGLRAMTVFRERKTMPGARRVLLGRYIVADPAICHGKPTFLGTRIMVAQVLTQVAKGMPWTTISAEWHGSITPDAIAEAAELAQRVAIVSCERTASIGSEGR